VCAPWRLQRPIVHDPVPSHATLDCSDDVVAKMKAQASAEGVDEWVEACLTQPACMDHARAHHGPNVTPRTCARCRSVMDELRHKWESRMLELGMAEGGAGSHTLPA
jgi:hypothetical protein